MEARVTEEGDGFLLTEELRQWMQKQDMKNVRTYEDEKKGEAEQDEEADGGQIECGVPDENGPWAEDGICKYKGTKNAVVNHRRTQHKMRTRFAELVIGNTCPNCGIRYKRGNEIGRKHLRRAIEELGECPEQRERRYEDEIKETIVDEITCGICQMEIRGKENVRQHMAEHMRTMMRETRRVREETNDNDGGGNDPPDGKRRKEEEDRMEEGGHRENEKEVGR